MIAEIHAASHAGRRRPVNEDNYLLLRITESEFFIKPPDSAELKVESQKIEIGEDGIVLAVADGEAAEVASQLAVESFGRKILTEIGLSQNLDADSRSSSLVGTMYQAVLYANQVMCQQGRAAPQYHGMGAVLTGISITSDEYVNIVQVGDSRAYLIRNSKIYQLTKDQSLVQKLIDEGKIPPEEADTHQLRNVILQALGVQNEIHPDMSCLSLKRDDILLLCSDGLYNKINPTQMQKIVAENKDHLETACIVLINEANECGGEDNITVILAHLTGDDLPEADVDGEVRLELLDVSGFDDPTI